MYLDFFSNLFSLSKEELLKHCKDLYLKLKDNSRGEADITLSMHTGLRTHVVYNSVNYSLNSESEENGTGG